MWWFILGYFILFIITYYVLKVVINLDKDSEGIKGKWFGVLLRFIFALFWPITIIIVIVAYIFTGIEEIVQKDPPKWL